MKDIYKTKLWFKTNQEEIPFFGGSIQSNTTGKEYKHHSEFEEQARMQLLNTAIESLGKPFIRFSNDIIPTKLIKRVYTTTEVVENGNIPKK